MMTTTRLAEATRSIAPAHALDHLAGDHPVGEVALLANLHGAQDGKVDVAAADLPEAVGAREDRRPLAAW